MSVQAMGDQVQARSEAPKPDAPEIGVINEYLSRPRLHRSKYQVNQAWQHFSYGAFIYALLKNISRWFGCRFDLTFIFECSVPPTVMGPVVFVHVPAPIKEVLVRLEASGLDAPNLPWFNKLPHVIMDPLS